MRLKIAIVAHGRFHAFDLARELLNRGHEVVLFTNYPARIVEQFGFPRKQVRSFLLHGVLNRVFPKIHPKALNFSEASLHKLFGRWASAELVKENWDVVHPWSGVAEEIFHSLNHRNDLKIMMRGSAHIRTQAELLKEEEDRTNTPQDRPSTWIIAREEREYELAEYIVVLSTFAYNSFLRQGIKKDKLCLLPLGARLEDFRPDAETIERRCQRILAGEPLSILYVGALSFQKGFYDSSGVIKSLEPNRFRFRLIGPVAPEVSPFLAELRHRVEFIDKRPQHELPDWYSSGDVFIFPTIHDGYAMVLAQASASSLPILTTTNCAGPDLIREGETGWVLPIRSPEAFIQRLRWCDTHREEVATMVRNIHDSYQTRDWADVAADFESLCLERLNVNARKAV